MHCTSQPTQWGRHVGDSRECSQLGKTGPSVGKNFIFRRRAVVGTMKYVVPDDGLLSR